MKLSPRDQLIVAIAAIVVAAVAVVVLVVMPRFRAVGQVKADIKVAEDQIAQARALLARRQGAKAGAAGTQAQLMRLANEFPDAPQLPALIIELQDVANDSGLDFASLQSDRPAVREGFAALPLSLQVSGEWADIIEFLRKLDKMTRRVRVLNLTVSPEAVSEEATGAPMIENVSISLEAFIMLPPAAVPAQ